MKDEISSSHKASDIFGLIFMPVLGIKDSKCPKIVQRQQQHQQQARNSKGEIQGSQISVMRRRSDTTGRFSFVLHLSIVPANLVGINKQPHFFAKFGTR